MNETAPNEGRRSSLKWLATAAAGLAAVCSTVIAGGFLYPVSRRKPAPLFVCLESEVPSDVPLEIKTPTGSKALLIRQPTGQIVTIGTVCTHLGCSVYYRPKEQRFDCPCHQGVFDAEGVPIAGPPREPLARYETEIRDGLVFIHFS